LRWLADRFFAWGSLRKALYGAAPIIQFNDLRISDLDPLPFLEDDKRLLEEKGEIGFFLYGPRLWMIGQVEPLLALQNRFHRKSVIKRILSEYPVRTLVSKDKFYRLRKEAKRPDDVGEYDSPPARLSGRGRLDSRQLAVMYGSQDLQICIHECRVAAEDNVFLATLTPASDLKLLDLTHILREEGVTEFESLDMAVHMVFLAGSHSYDICRAIAKAAKHSGFDGVIYPSYYSLLSTGSRPFETNLGMSLRIWEKFAEYEQAKTVSNLAIFGRPIKERKVQVVSLNRVILSKAAYDVHFGPAIS